MMKYWNASQQQRFMDGAHALGVMVLFNLEDVGTRGSGERTTHVTRYNNTRTVPYLATMPADGLRSLTARGNRACMDTRLSAMTDVL